MTDARRSIISTIIDHAIADGCEPCSECDGDPNCSNCGGSGYLDSAVEDGERQVMEVVG